MKTDNSFKKPIKILYEDEYFLAFDKPSGLLVIPTPKKENKTLSNIVNYQFEKAHPDHNQFKLHPCHRLDRDTSGVILFAKGKRNQQLLMNEFKKQTVKKKYIAFVHGRLKTKKGSLKGAIKDMDQMKYQKKSRAKMAITEYNAVSSKKEYSVVEVRPLTGRTNQIRIQFRNMGHPLVGERKYAFGKHYKLKFKRTALHANEIEWVHPILKKRIKVVSSLPADMEKFLNLN